MLYSDSAFATKKQDNISYVNNTAQEQLEALLSLQPID